MNRTLPAVGLLAMAASCATVTDEQRACNDVTRGQELRTKNRPRDAAAAYAQALEEDPHNLAALRGYVELEHLIGETAPTLARFRHAVAEHPSDPYAHEGLGLALFAAGGTSAEHARDELARAADLAPETADFHYRLGLLYVESDRFEEAIKPLAKAVALDAQMVRYRLPYALALARTGDRATAVRQLTAVLSLAPTHDEVTLAEKTAKSLVNPFRAFPVAAREQWEVAMGLLDHDSPTEASQVLDSLMQRYPDIAIVHTLAGLAAAKADDASRAIYELRRAIEIDPGLAEPRLYLGDIYNSHGRPDEAREHYEAAIERNPFLADAYKRLAEVHLKSNELPEAARCYRTYLLLRPEDADALIAHAKVLEDMNSPDAGAAWDQAVEEYPTRVEVLVPRARHYFTVAAKATDPAERAHAKAECRKSLEKAIDMDSENATASAILGELDKLK